MKPMARGLLLLAFAGALVSASLLATHGEEDTSGYYVDPDRLNVPPDDRNAPRGSDRRYDDARELPDIDSPSPIRPKAEAHFGERWGAIWIERSVSPSRLVFGVVSPTEADREFVRRLTDDDPRTDVVAVRYGTRQLERWRADIQPLVERWAEGPEVMFTIGIDPKSGTIFIEEDPVDPNLRSDIEALGIPDDAYTLRRGGGASLV
jgi:hypothetical protein